MNYKQIVISKEKGVQFVLGHCETAAADAAISILSEESEIASLAFLARKNTTIKNHYRLNIYKSIGELA